RLNKPVPKRRPVGDVASPPGHPGHVGGRLGGHPTQQAGGIADSVAGPAAEVQKSRRPAAQLGREVQTGQAAAAEPRRPGAFGVRSQLDGGQPGEAAVAAVPGAAAVDTDAQAAQRGSPAPAGQFWTAPEAQLAQPRQLVQRVDKFVRHFGQVGRINELQPAQVRVARQAAGGQPAAGREAQLAQPGPPRVALASRSSWASRSASGLPDRSSRFRSDDAGVDGQAGQAAGGDVELGEVRERGREARQRKFANATVAAFAGQVELREARPELTAPANQFGEVDSRASKAAAEAQSAKLAPAPVGSEVGEFGQEVDGRRQRCWRGQRGGEAGPGRLADCGQAVPVRNREVGTVDFAQALSGRCIGPDTPAAASAERRPERSPRAAAAAAAAMTTLRDEGDVETVLLYNTEACMLRAAFKTAATSESPTRQIYRRANLRRAVSLLPKELMDSSEQLQQAGDELDDRSDSLPQPPLEAPTRPEPAAAADEDEDKQLALLKTIDVEDIHTEVAGKTSRGAIRRIARASSCEAPTPAALAAAAEAASEDDEDDEDKEANEELGTATAAAETDKPSASEPGSNSRPAAAVAEDSIAAGVTALLLNEAEQQQQQKQQQDDVEETLTAEWRTADRHVFVMSRSGKPIFSRHGNEEKLVTHMGVMTALVSVVEDSDDQVHWFESADRRFVFLAKEFLILVCICRSAESPTQLLLQLNYLYNQILSLLTFTVLKRAFRKSNYDLRHLLPDADRFLTGLLQFMERDIGPLLGAVQCLPLPKSTRDAVGDAICSGARVKDLVFGILLSGTKLVSLVHMKRQYLHPLDMHLIINLINCTESFKTSQAWTPICLPKFDASGNLYAYVCFLDEELCLVLLTVDGNSFDALAEAKNKILEKLQKANCLAQIRESAVAGQWTLAQTGAEEVRHFVYKIKLAGQYFSPQMGDPFGQPEDQQRVMALYQRMHALLHRRTRPLKLVYHTNQLASVMGWITEEFELYAAFSPLASKRSAIQSVNRVLKWLGRERDRLFCLSSPSF
uniref:Vacuolar fusion protein MON1 homolog n=2 Tax=Macrostomum lignano TaxID=282301 RepID=A0A1I8IQP4_9PLAT